MGDSRVFLTLLLLASVTVEAQGLGAAAQKEKEKRGSTPAAKAADTRVYTADDLVALGASQPTSAGAGEARAGSREREEAAEAALQAAQEDLVAAEKATSAALDSKGDREARDRKFATARRRQDDAIQAVRRAQQDLEAAREEVSREDGQAAGTPSIRLAVQSNDEAGPGISKEERFWRDRVESARSGVAKAEEKLAAEEKAKADLGPDPTPKPGDVTAYAIRWAGQMAQANAKVKAAREELAYAESALKEAREAARKQGFDLR